MLQYTLQTEQLSYSIHVSHTKLTSLWLYLHLCSVFCLVKVYLLKIQKMGKFLHSFFSGTGDIIPSIQNRRLQLIEPESQVDKFSHIQCLFWTEERKLKQLLDIFLR